MPLLAPPPSPPRVLVADYDGRRRFHRRMTRVTAALVTVLITGWSCTLGVLPAIIALSIAKHVLVAILMMDLGVDAPPQEEDC
jgi:hypothetical protein